MTAAADNSASLTQCRACGGCGYVSEHDGGCDGNCEQHGCPIQIPCQLCEGAGVEFQPEVITPLPEEEMPF